MQDSIESRHFFLTGRVQGVGFRYFVFRAALETGIRGWVRNLPDGRVEIRAEGRREALLNFRKKIEIGPALASVRKVSSEKADLENFGDFQITG